LFGQSLAEARAIGDAWRLAEARAIGDAWRLASCLHGLGHLAVSHPRAQLAAWTAQQAEVSTPHADDI
jgi:hypothetical protein